VSNRMHALYIAGVVGGGLLLNLIVMVLLEAT
jgi:hypothetical protein